MNAPTNLPHFEGWHLIGAFPDHEPDDVGSWLLMDDGEAMLLEVPEGLTVGNVWDALADTGTTLRYVTASHDHWDHLDRNVWGDLAGAFPKARFVHPASVRGDRQFQIGSEVVWLVAAPKHSLADIVTVFRGVAMTGDIELGMLASVTDEVPLATRRRSMRRLQGFEQRIGYHVHSVVSAHLNNVRLSVRWPDLFEFQPEGR
jgi:glyoxylase-like metal-dependent hydrolase (beta-lactamase superfamily II)